MSVADTTVQVTNRIVSAIRSRRLDYNGVASQFISYVKEHRLPHSFNVTLPDGTRHLIGNNEPSFSVVVRNARGLRALATLDEMLAAEAYMDGDIDVEGSMLDAFSLRSLFQDPHPLQYVQATYLSSLLFGQEESDSKWIRAHYDVDAEFFELWLDPRIRGYSHGFFENDDESLEDGMERKFQYAFDACRIKPGQRVLDIGGGWGSFLEFASRKGVHVTSVTLSSASAEYMRKLVAKHKFPATVVQEHFLKFKAQPFDAIVNLGVTEHLPDYGRSVAQYARLLKPGGFIYLDAYSGEKHAMPAFITKWVFEGNTSPMCLKEYLGHVAEHPFELIRIENDRHNYFLTCKKWAENLDKVKDEVIKRWGEHLYRRFSFYLWVSAGAFQAGSLSAHRMLLRRVEGPWHDGYGPL